MKVITIGDNVVDCYLDKNEYFPGGNAVNVAVNSKRCGAEKVGYIGVFATDDKAEHIKHSLDIEGIDYHLSRIVEGVSGQPRVNLTEDGDRIFVSSPKNTVQHKVKLRLTEEDYEYISQFDVCHTSCYSSLEEELSELSNQIKISFDFSENYCRSYLQKVCPYISFGFFSGASLSDSEIESLIQIVSEYGVETIGITRGSRPAIFINNGLRYYQEVVNVNILDTMGAGDSFIGGYLTEYIKQGDVEQALRFAAKKASVTCGFYGGFGHPKKFNAL